MAAPPSLQVAQILADLNDLQNTDPASTTPLLLANKTVSAKLQRRRSKSSNLYAPPLFDKLGRRIISPPSRAPSYKRTDSTFSRTSSKYEDVMGTGNAYGNGNGSVSVNVDVRSDGFYTPLETPGEDDEDMKRAKTLIELYEMRGKMKQWGDTGLARAKERVDDVVERYKRKEAEERKRAGRPVY